MRCLQESGVRTWTVPTLKISSRDWVIHTVSHWIFNGLSVAVSIAVRDLQCPPRLTTNDRS